MLKGKTQFTTGRYCKSQWKQRIAIGFLWAMQVGETTTTTTTATKSEKFCKQWRSPSASNPWLTKFVEVRTWRPFGYVQIMESRSQKPLSIDEFRGLTSSSKSNNSLNYLLDYNYMMSTHATQHLATHDVNIFLTFEFNMFFFWTYDSCFFSRPLLNGPKKNTPSEQIFVRGFNFVRKRKTLSWPESDAPEFLCVAFSADAWNDDFFFLDGRHHRFFLF